MRTIASLMLAGSLVLAAHAQAPTPPGACLLAGGGKLPPAVFARFLELAGGSDAKVVLVPTASETADSDAENADTLRLYRERLPGAEVTLLHTRDRAVADTEAFCAPLRSATGVWFTGGAQDRIAAAYLGTRCEREVMAVLARGGVVGGTSAGTAIQTRVMIAGGKNPPEIATGFDCVPGAISDQHFLKRQRLPRLLQALALHPGLVGIGVDESTAAVVRGDTLEVVGASQVVLALPAHDGHGERVLECAPGDAVSWGNWRRAAGERAAWSLTAPAEPRVASGTLLVGDADGMLGRFVELAGGAQADIALLTLREPTPAATDALLAAGPANVHEAMLLGTGTFGGDDLREVLARATGVWLQDPRPDDSVQLLDRVDAALLRELVQQVLARGGVVWGNAVLGEAIADVAGPGYRRGLGLLPGVTLVHRPAPTPEPTADAWLAARQTELPRCAGLHTAGALMVQGSTCTVLGSQPAHLLLPRGAGTATATALRLEPGATCDLVSGARR
ncbi:MAG: cyanophycinase [Planctomycetes bacterium]|nr:cyanophycinase [Planctomycetota bacterium]